MLFVIGFAVSIACQYYSGPIFTKCFGMGIAKTIASAALSTLCATASVNFL